MKPPLQDKIKRNVQKNQIQSILTRTNFGHCFYDLVNFALFASGFPILFKKILILFLLPGSNSFPISIIIIVRKLHFSNENVKATESFTDQDQFAGRAQFAGRGFLQ